MSIRFYFLQFLLSIAPRNHPPTLGIIPPNPEDYPRTLKICEPSLADPPDITVVHMLNAMTSVRFKGSHISYPRFSTSTLHHSTANTCTF